jgi:hypothetical protein
MRKFTNPLDDLRIASPCLSDWNGMYGNERKRFCSECKLNVYNLSDMSQTEAENLLLNAEGRLCVRFYRRKDGTVLTKDCPVGWNLVKRRAAKRVTAVFSILAGFFAGVFTVRSVDSFQYLLPIEEVPDPVTTAEQVFVGELMPVAEVGGISAVDVRGRVDINYYKKKTSRSKIRR